MLTGVATSNIGNSEMASSKHGGSIDKAEQQTEDLSVHSLRMTQTWDTSCVIETTRWSNKDRL